MTKKEKRQFLLENNWGTQYHYNCWFDHSKDNLDVNGKGEITGFQPEERGLSFKEAFKKCTINISKKI